MILFIFPNHMFKQYINFILQYNQYKYENFNKTLYKYNVLLGVGQGGGLVRHGTTSRSAAVIFSLQPI